MIKQNFYISSWKRNKVISIQTRVIKKQKLSEGFYKTNFHGTNFKKNLLKIFHTTNQNSFGN